MSLDSFRSWAARRCPAANQRLTVSKRSSSSVLREITIAGVLNIKSLVSTAVAAITAKGQNPPTGMASTVVSGASVNGVPVEITSRGLRVSDQVQGEEQKAQLGQQIQQALAGAHVENIRMAEATTSRTKDGALVVDAGALLVTYRDSAFAAANPQGFGGGGFSFGGASVTLDARRADATGTETSSGATNKHVVVADRGQVSALAPRTS